MRRLPVWLHSKQKTYAGNNYLIDEQKSSIYYIHQLGMQSKIGAMNLLTLKLPELSKLVQIAHNYKVFGGLRVNILPKAV